MSAPEVLSDEEAGAYGRELVLRLLGTRITAFGTCDDDGGQLLLGTVADDGATTSLVIGVDAEGCLTICEHQPEKPSNVV